MRKKYCKPMAYVEELQLSQQIASCGAGSRGDDNPFGTVNSSNSQVCGFMSSQFGTTIFVTGNEGCAKKVKPGESAGGVCYNTVAAGYTIFAS